LDTYISVGFLLLNKRIKIKMIKTLIASATVLLAGTFCGGAALAMPGASSIGTTVGTQSFTSRIVSESQEWGDYSEFGFDVGAGISGGGVAINFQNGGLDLSAGGLANFSVYELEGGFYNESRAVTDITGRSVTSTTHFY
jgi:hypothetical protein